MKKEEKLILLANYFKSHATISTKLLASMKIQYCLLQDFIKEDILIQVGRGCFQKGEHLQAVESYMNENTCDHSKKTRRRSKNDLNLKEIEKYLQTKPIVDTKELTSMGISSYNVKKLVEEEVLIKISRGCYQRGNGALSKENNIIDKNVEIDLCPSENTLSFEEFEQLLLNKKYNEAFKKGVCIENFSIEEKNLFNLYLILLSQIMELSINEKIYIQNLKIEDCKLVEEEFSTENNKIRLSIFYKNFATATRQIKNKYENSNQIEKTDQILLDLLQEISKINREIRVLEIELQRKGQYLELQNLLIKQQEKGSFTQNEKFLLHLVNLICSNEPIQYSTKVCYSVFEGIECQNYKKALEWDEKYASDNQLREDQRTLTIALRKVMEMIELQKKGGTSKEVTQDTTSSNVSKKKFSTVENITIPQILKVLWEGDLNTSIILLEQYLKMQHKFEYFNLLKELLQLDSLNNDPFYKTFYEVLFQIEAGTYEYSMTTYLLAFASCVDENPEQAEVYLNILKTGKDLGLECYVISELSKKVENAKQSYVKSLS